MSGHGQLPEGDVTFLFTDVEGSTRLLEQHPAAYGRLIARHHELIEDAVARHRGVVFETIGDAVYAAFAEPVEGVAAAHASQLALAEEDWGELDRIKVRMAVHNGQVERRGAHYFGPALYRCQRIMATAHGGQVVLSESAASLVREPLEGGLALIDLGRHELRDLREPERIYQLAGPGLEVEFPPLDSVGGRPNNLPADVKTFVGRQEELGELRDLLRMPGVRVVTLTGAGGSGKTRLALRAAEGLLEPFKDGVFVVDLAPLGAAALVPPAIAAVLGVPPTAGRSTVDSLVTHVGDRELLLVLDNFEHVAAAAPDVATLIASTPMLRVLVTSRVPLRIQGEREVHVEPLPVPRPDAGLDELVRSPALQLFAERSREIRGTFALDEANAGTVAEVCRRLDGLPLAIELAAARTRLLSPAALLERLDDRLALLTGGATDLPSRQRTMRDTIAWSYDLLDEPERTLLRRLAVFSGGCSLAAAETVCGDDVLESLSVLAEHSLLLTRWDELGEPRFELLETVAEFARARLADSGEADELAGRHAAYFADHAEAVEPALYSDARGPWLRRLEDDRDNFRAALSWSVAAGDVGVGLRILGSLWLWWWTSFNEGLEWAERVLSVPVGAARPTAERAAALFTAEICAAGAGDLPTIRRYAEEAVSVARTLGDDRRLALAQALGAGALTGLTPTGDFEGERLDGRARLRALSDEAIEIGARSGDRWVAAWTKMISALIALLAGDPAPAPTWASEAMAEFAELDDSWSRASASMSLAFALIQLGELEQAEDALDGSVPALLDVGDLKMAGGCLIAHGLIGRFSGRLEDAERHYRDAFELCVRAGDPGNAPACLEGIAAAVTARDPKEAARLLGAARELFDTGCFPSVPGFEVFHDATLAQLAESLAAEDLESLRTRGASTARTVPLSALTTA